MTCTWDWELTIQNSHGCESRCRCHIYTIAQILVDYPDWVANFRSGGSSLHSLQRWVGALPLFLVLSIFAPMDVNANMLLNDLMFSKKNLLFLSFLKYKSCNVCGRVVNGAISIIPCMQHIENSGLKVFRFLSDLSSYHINALQSLQTKDSSPTSKYVVWSIIMIIISK